MSEDRPNDEERTFESMYRGRPPWEIDRPQPAFVALSDAGEIRGTVLDVGCGTGENALLFAARGHDVLGVDTAGAAVERAREKARERGLDAEFRVHDAYDLASLDRQFDTVVDSGLFHVLVRADPRRYAASLRSAIRQGGRLFVLGFDDREEGRGPATSRADIREAFTDGWRVDAIEESVYETVGVEDHRRRARLATVRAT